MEKPRRNKKHVKLLFFIVNTKENLRILDNIRLLCLIVKKGSPILGSTADRKETDITVRSTIWHHRTKILEMVILFEPAIIYFFKMFNKIV